MDGKQRRLPEIARLSLAEQKTRVDGRGAERVVGPREEIRKGLAPLAKILPDWVRQAVQAVHIAAGISVGRVVEANLREALRRLDGQSSQADGIQELEYGGVGARSQGK